MDPSSLMTQLFSQSETKRNGFYLQELFLKLTLNSQRYYLRYFEWYQNVKGRGRWAGTFHEQLKTKLINLTETKLSVIQKICSSSSWSGFSLTKWCIFGTTILFVIDNLISLLEYFPKALFQRFQGEIQILSHCWIPSIQMFTAFQEWI